MGGLVCKLMVWEAHRREFRQYSMEFDEKVGDIFRRQCLVSSYMNIHVY